MSTALTYWDIARAAIAGICAGFCVGAAFGVLLLRRNK